MKSPRLPGVWFYERLILDCLCVVKTAGRESLYAGEEKFCYNHMRIARIAAVAPATLAQQDALLETMPAPGLVA